MWFDPRPLEESPSKFNNFNLSIKFSMAAKPSYGCVCLFSITISLSKCVILTPQVCGVHKCTELMFASSVSRGRCGHLNSKGCQLVLTSEYRARNN